MLNINFARSYSKPISSICLLILASRNQLCYRTLCYKFRSQMLCLQAESDVSVKRSAKNTFAGPSRRIQTQAHAWHHVKSINTNVLSGQKAQGNWSTRIRIRVFVTARHLTRVIKNPENWSTRIVTVSWTRRWACSCVHTHTHIRTHAHTSVWFNLLRILTTANRVKWRLHLYFVLAAVWTYIVLLVPRCWEKRAPQSKDILSFRPFVRPSAIIAL